MEYSFKGIITSYKNCTIPFDVCEGRVRLDVSNLPSKEVNHFDSNGHEYITGIPAFKQEYLEGATDNGLIIRLHINSYYEGDYHFFYPNSDIHYIYGNISSCIVLDKNKYKNNIDKVGFYALNINKITGQSVSGVFNEKHFQLLGKDRYLATYNEKGNKYIVSYDFIGKKHFCSDRVITVESDKKLNQGMLEDVFWTMRKFFAFVYRKKEIPLSDVVLFEKDIVVGHLFIQKFSDDREFMFGVKCLQVTFWGEKLSNLFQTLVDKKIYLRHLPEYGDEKHNYTPSRYLSTVVGLESSLNILGIKADYSIEHLEAIKKVKNELQKLIDGSKGKEKQEYKRLLKSTNGERFVDKVLVAIKENIEYINNFFNLSRLDEDINIIAEDISKSRNHFAHGYLEEDLSIKHTDQCDFMDLFILYLQLLYVGFTKEDASRTVPLVIFEH